ncbi:hypothetical protein, partial [Aureimonas psammosilenae]|uniref:hypothetical protein n=1 Tax=Aureimonas psammosilenae TaxID=2495496 RepID=UPI001AEF2EC1
RSSWEGSVRVKEPGSSARTGRRSISATRSHHSANDEAAALPAEAGSFIHPPRLFKPNSVEGRKRDARFWLADAGKLPFSSRQKQMSHLHAGTKHLRGPVQICCVMGLSATFVVPGDF